MKAVLGFTFLLSLIAYCHFYPRTEFDIDFQDLEKSYQHCPINCQEAQESECQCLHFSQTMNCPDQVIEDGLRKLNLVCNNSDPKTHTICRILKRIKELVAKNQKMCRTPRSQHHIWNYIRTVNQEFNSIPSSQKGKL